MEKTIIIKGKHCIETILFQHNDTPSPIQELYIDTKQKKMHQDLIDLAQKKQIPISYPSPSDITPSSGDARSKQRKHKDAPMEPILHQGIAALCLLPKQYRLQDLKQHASKLRFVVLLDHLQDAFNFGAIMRSAVALHVDAIIYPNKRNCPITAGVIQASAGASHLLKHYQVPNLVQSIQALKNLGFWVYGSALNQKISLQDCPFHAPLALVFGNESKGLSAQLQKQCHDVVSIDQSTKIDSLNVGAAAAIMLYSATQKNNFHSNIL